MKQTYWLMPILLLILAAPATPYLDLNISQYFYSESSGFSKNAYFRFFYNYGEWPAFFAFSLSCSIFTASYCLPKMRPLRKPALVMLITFVLGAGLITNLILKDHWGRPRPVHTKTFGGKYSYRPFYSPDFGNYPDGRKSFPSGHAAVGYYFFALISAGRILKSKRTVRTGLVVVIFLGFSLSLARIGAGAHFFSDVLVSGLIMWLTTFAVEAWIERTSLFSIDETKD